MTTSTASLVQEPRRILALASALRQDIVDVLVASGPASVAEIASALGRRPDSLYYHLRRLRAADLVRQVGTQGEGRGLEAVYDVMDRPLKIVYRPSSRRNVQAIQKMGAAMLRSAQRTFDASFDRDDVAVDGPARNVWTGRLVGRLTTGELRELNRHLAAIDRVFARASGRRRGALQTMTFSLAPLDDRTSPEETDP